MSEDKGKEVVEMTPDQLQDAIAKAQPKMRQLIIETDGQMVSIAKSELSPLEVRAVCQMLLDQGKK